MDEKKVKIYYYLGESGTMYSEPSTDDFKFSSDTTIRIEISKLMWDLLSHLWDGDTNVRVYKILKEKQNGKTNQAASNP